jgi:glycosyltransferase involved in cell wall biosynthesis
MIKAEVQPQTISADTSLLVSVIIPAYNAANYIGEALNSVFDQTFRSHESIVINDGSPDTLELERELQAYGDNIRYIKQANRGAAAARNAGLLCARGDYVAFLDADDRWLPNFLEEQIEFLKLNDADFVFSDALLCGETPLAGRTFMELEPPKSAVTPESLLAVDVAVLTSAVLARKQPIIEVGLFDETIKRGHDFELWFRLAKAGIRFAYHPKVLAEYRVVASGLSGNALSQLCRTLSVLEAVKAKGTLTQSEEAALNLNMKRTRGALALESGKEKLLGGDFEGALESLKEAQRYLPSLKLRVASLGVRIAPGTVRRLCQRRSGATRSG